MRIHRPAHSRGGNPDAVVILAAVVEAWQCSRNDFGRLLILEKLEAAPEVSKRLIVETQHRLKAEQIDRLIGVLEVVRLPRRNGREIRGGPPVQDAESGLI